jgi:hypothetical protein
MNDRFEVEAARADIERRLSLHLPRFARRRGGALPHHEASQLRQLTTDWVARALDNLRAAHGMAWLERCLCSDAGLQLHAEGAADPY